MTIPQLLRQTAQQARPAAMQPNDYIEDGLIFCGQCHTAKQARIPIPGGDVVTVSCLCQCATAARNAELKQRRKQEEFDRVQRLRTDGITSKQYRTARFADDDGTNPAMKVLRNYAESWEQMRDGNNGLFLYGAVGTGKTFGAACVANALIEQLVPVYMGTFATVLNGLGETFEKNTLISKIMQYPLLILDDFGAERNTEYALEQLFNVIDARYQAGKPLILTSNLSLADLKNPADNAHRRVYDRVLEMCHPVNFGIARRRADIPSHKLQAVRQILQS